MGRGPKPAKGKAEPAVPRKSPKSDGAKVRDLEKRLAESLEREKATGELLHEKSRASATCTGARSKCPSTTNHLLRG